MLVVADSSPLIVLVNIGHIDVLPALFVGVTIPSQVAQEVGDPRRPRPVLDFINTPPPWLTVQNPASVEAIPLLHAGETAAISLARELNADLLLIDEVQGRRAAAARNIKLTGTVGVLELAAEARLLDLKNAFDRLKQTDFWISNKLLDERLALFQKRQGP